MISPFRKKDCQEIFAFLTPPPPPTALARLKRLYLKESVHNKCVLERILGCPLELRALNQEQDGCFGRKKNIPMLKRIIIIVINHNHYIYYFITPTCCLHYINDHIEKNNNTITNIPILVWKNFKNALFFSLQKQI